MDEYSCTMYFEKKNIIKLLDGTYIRNYPLNFKIQVKYKNKDECSIKKECKKLILDKLCEYRKNLTFAMRIKTALYGVTWKPKSVPAKINILSKEETDEFYIYSIQIEGNLIRDCIYK